MAALPVMSGSELSYNGYTFDSFVKSKIASSPQYDASGRTVTHTRILLDVQARVQSASGTGTTMTTMRQSLETPGGVLHYDGLGFGTLTVNSGAVKDIAFGPKPQLLEFTALGGANAALVHWVCEINIPDQCSSPAYSGRIMEHNWQWSHIVDIDGYSSYTVSGYVVIPMTRTSVSARTPPDSVDNYRHRVFYPVPPGFQRENSKWDVSQDKRRAEFSFFDREMAAPLPDHCTVCNVRHRASWSLGGQSNQSGILNSISGNITIQAGMAKSLAGEKFHSIVSSRIMSARKLANAAFPIILRYEVDEEINGRSSNFLCDYVFAGYQLEDLLAASGVWNPIEGTDFGRWKSSLDQKAWSIRGNAGIRINQGGELIIDLCGTAQPSPPKPTPKAPPAGGKSGGSSGSNIVGGIAQQLVRLPIFGRRPTTVTRPPAAASVVNPANSWLAYDCWYEFHWDNGVAIHQPIADANDGAISRSNPRPDAGGNSIINATDGKLYPAIAGALTIAQQARKPACTVTLVGVAERVAYPIPIPKITKIGGARVVEITSDVSVGVVRAINGLPVNAAAWSIEYEVLGEPKGPFALPVNPALGFRGLQ